MSKYVNIRKTISLRQEKSRAIHSSIRKAKGLERHELWLEKRRYGIETRHLLLAFAWLRRVPYSVVEARCIRPPSPSAIADLANAYGAEACEIDAIKRWLAPPSSEG